MTQMKLLNAQCTIPVLSMPLNTVKESLSGGKYTTVAWAMVTERGNYQEETLRQWIVNAGIIMHLSAKPQENGELSSIGKHAYCTPAEVSLEHRL